MNKKTDRAKNVFVDFLTRELALNPIKVSYSGTEHAQKPAVASTKLLCATILSKKTLALQFTDGTHLSQPLCPSFNYQLFKVPFATPYDTEQHNLPFLLEI